MEAVLAAGEGDRKLADKKIAEAIKLDSGFQPFHYSEYAIASAYALMNRKSKSGVVAKEGADDGFPCYLMYVRNRNLASLHGDQGYESFMAQLRSEWQRNSPRSTERRLIRT
jgi:hypothetical protein